MLKAPFPWFGGKSRVAHIVWQALGNVQNYVEPFFGSGAVLLARPHRLTWRHVERINDADGFICNFYRAVAKEPDEVAAAATWTTSECDLHARHAYLTELRANLTSRLEGDPFYYDAHIAGWWLWAINLWIGSGFASGEGAWSSHDGRLIQSGRGNRGRGINRQRPHLSNKGQGINRQFPHLGDKSENIRDYMWELHERMSRVDVMCGDWNRVCRPLLTEKQGLAGVFLDPPYDMGMRDTRLYTQDTHGLSPEVKKWAVSQGDNPIMRIVLCGYEGEHGMPDTWQKMDWKTRGGYASSSNGTVGKQSAKNASLERLWLSPHCLSVDNPQWEQVEMWG